MTFKEKSIFIQLVTILLVFGSYFLNMDYNFSDGFPPDLSFHFVWLIVVLIVLNIVGHIFAAAFNKPENEDERDTLIELKATRIKAFILTSSMVITLLVSLKLQNEYITINLLLLFLVASEVIEKAIQLFYYRKGI
jgi:ABC-type sugar transport system permease subunit